MRQRVFLTSVLLCLLQACGPTGDESEVHASTAATAAGANTSASTSQGNSAIGWVQHSAEFEALSLQAFAAAASDLDGYIADTSWSALPWQTDAADLPPAIITDVDETMVSNAEFQATYEHPFTNHKLDRWNNRTTAVALPGAVDFIRRAQDAGVRVFFLTNRPCETLPGIDDPCPQKAVTIQDLNEAGFAADDSTVMLSHEKPDWGREKSVRRRHIGESHRIIMLLGDDLGDFIPCTRAKPLASCDEGATVASRSAVTLEYARYWGNGWYILPNPMHGSWTSVK